LQTKGDGQGIPIDDSIAPIRDDFEEAQGVVVVFRDCTARRLAEEAAKQFNVHLERVVEERTAQLETTHRELASFSYSISHDLRAPLRAMTGFSAILAEKYANLLDKEGQRFLEVIQKNGQRMGEMIDDFLRLFCLVQEPLHIRPVNMTQLVREVVEHIAHQFPDAVELPQVEILPSAAADPGLIRQVWVNLITNALKFSRHRPRPIVQIGARMQSTNVQYYVKDNGVGFDMRYANNLFGVFQRLHSRQEFEGTGIGLATVARIVRMHGGDVGAEAELEKGATFYFTLPVAREGIEA